MTIERKIEMLRAMLDDPAADGNERDSDGTLQVYLELAGYKILNKMYQFPEFYDDYEGLEVPDRYVMAQLNICCYLLNKRGAEGEIQHIEGGIHRNYGASDVPDAMLKDITPYCRAIR